MSVVRSVIRHPLTIIGCALLGTLTAAVFPVMVPVMTMINSSFVAVLQMAALPLMALALVFGLRRLLELPHPPRRILRLMGAAAALLVATAGVGLLAALLAHALIPTTDQDRESLSALVHAANHATAITLGQAPQVTQEEPGWTSLIPANLFHVLVQGQIPAMVIGAVLFGLALHLQSSTGPAGSALNATFTLLEAGYRALEVMIDRITLALPLAAWAMAGTTIAGIDSADLAAMSGLLGPLALCALMFAGITALAVGWSARVPFPAALQALVRPAIIALLAPTPGASIPTLLSTLSDRLGFSRGVVELLVPSAPFLLRLGEALYFSMLFVFLCGLYARPIALNEAVLILAASCAAAMVSVEMPVGRTLTAGTLGLTWLELPIEAVTPILLGLELLSYGLRQVVSDLGACALVVWISHDVARVKRDDGLGMGQAAPDAIPFGVLNLNRGRLMWVSALSLAALLAAFMLGVGLALRSP